MKPMVSILTGPGTNRHFDMGLAFELAGAEVSYVDVRNLPEDSQSLSAAQIIGVAGGFSYADALGSARIFARELFHRTGDLLQQQISAGVPVIGICNGFQMLVRSGVLPGSSEMSATLAQNARATFECRWVTLAAPSTKSMWTKGLEATLSCPVAHGEGRFFTDEKSLAVINAKNLVALRYVMPNGSPAALNYPYNPNGSLEDIAGICDESGLVLGLMPHPENHVTQRQGLSGSTVGPGGLALQLFRNGVHHVSA
jgi:phosphoribosylformylglycinamidine synthase